MMATPWKTVVLLLAAVCAAGFAHRTSGYKPYRVVLPFPRKHQRTPHRAIGCLHYGHSCLGAHGKRSAANEEEWTANLLRYLGLTEQVQENRAEPMANVHVPQSLPLRPMAGLPESEDWVKPNADVSSEAPNTRSFINGPNIRPILLRSLARTEQTKAEADTPKDKSFLDSDYENYDDMKYNAPKILQRFARSVSFTGEGIKGAMKKLLASANESIESNKSKLNSILFRNPLDKFGDNKSGNNAISFVKHSAVVRRPRNSMEETRASEEMHKKTLYKELSSGNQDENSYGEQISPTDLSSSNPRYRRRAILSQPQLESRLFKTKKTEDPNSE